MDSRMASETWESVLLCTLLKTNTFRIWWEDSQTNCYVLDVKYITALYTAWYIFHKNSDCGITQKRKYWEWMDEWTIITGYIWIGSNCLIIVQGVLELDNKIPTFCVPWYNNTWQICLTSEKKRNCKNFWTKYRKNN